MQPKIEKNCACLPGIHALSEGSGNRRNGAGGLPVCFETDFSQYATALFMRRKEKQIEDPAAIEAVIRHAQVCRVAFSDDTQPYIVPLCFGYADRTVYVHGALEGKKIDILRRNPKVCVAFDVDVEIVPAAEACKWGVKYRSVIAFGKAFVIEDPVEKGKALNVIMRHYAGKDFQYPEKAFDATAVIRIDIARMTGKQSRL
jgi:uncharacterized protein